MPIWDPEMDPTMAKHGPNPIWGPVMGHHGAVGDLETHSRLIPKLTPDSETQKGSRFGNSPPQIRKLTSPDSETHRPRFGNSPLKIVEKTLDWKILSKPLSCYIRKAFRAIAKGACALHLHWQNKTLSLDNLWDPIWAAFEEWGQVMVASGPV